MTINPEINQAGQSFYSSYATGEARSYREAVAREAEEGTLIPVQQMSQEELLQCQSYMNQTLGHIDTLRNPSSLPDLNALACQDAPVEPDASGAPESPLPAIDADTAGGANTAGGTEAAGGTGSKGMPLQFVPFSEVPRSAVAKSRWGDCSEAREVREGFHQTETNIAWARENTERTVKQYGPGTRHLDQNTKLTITKQNGKVTVVREGKMPMAYGGMLGMGMAQAQAGSGTSKKTPPVMYQNFRQVDEYTEGGSRDFRSTSDVGGHKSIMERKGDSLLTSWGDTTTRYKYDKGTLMKSETSRKDGSLRQSGANDDGSAWVKGWKKGEGGLKVTGYRTIPRNQHAAELGPLVKARSFYLDENGQKKPLTDDQIGIFINGLEKFEKADIERIKKEGVTFAVADRNKTPRGGYPGVNGRWPDAYDKGPAGGYYQCGSKTIVVAKDCLYQNVITHETGHALDDALAPDSRSMLGKISYNYRSDGDKELQTLYASYVSRSKGKNADKSKIWSDYGLKNVKEYLAEGIEAYQSPQANIRNSLRDNDQKFYKYLEKLLHNQGR